jgi:hypothetical protein
VMPRRRKSFITKPRSSSDARSSEADGAPIARAYPRRDALPRAR